MGCSLWSQSLLRQPFISPFFNSLRQRTTLVDYCLQQYRP
jgi:hypothetical protein